MTFREFLKAELESLGMWPEDADEAINRAVEEDTTSMRWDDDTDGYPPQLKAVVLLNVGSHAVSLVKEKCPGAFYLPILVERFGEAA